MNRLGSLIADGRAAGDTDEMTAARVREDETIEKHADWVAKFLPKYPEISKNNIEDILREEIGRVFTGVLEDAGVYKWTDEGHEAFLKFLKEAVK